MFLKEWGRQAGRTVNWCTVGVALSNLQKYLCIEPRISFIGLCMIDMLLHLWIYKEIHCSFAHYGKWLEAKNALLEDTVNNIVIQPNSGMSHCCHKTKKQKIMKRKERRKKIRQVFTYRYEMIPRQN